MNSKDNINQVKEFDSIFPVFLYDMPYIKLIQRMIKIHSITLFLFYKLGTENMKLNIVKSKIAMYHQKKKWFDGLRHLQGLGLINYIESKIHRIQPENVHLTKYGEIVLEAWKDSPLFKAFQWLEEEDSSIFQSVLDFDEFFHNNFRAYNTQLNNIDFKKRIPPNNDSQDIISIECGFCSGTHEVSKSKRSLINYFKKKNILKLKAIKCEQYRLEFSFDIFFNYKFSMSVHYIDSNQIFTEAPQECISNTIVWIPKNNDKIEVRYSHKIHKKENQKRKNIIQIKQIIEPTPVNELKVIEIEDKQIQQKNLDNELSNELQIDVIPSILTREEVSKKKLQKNKIECYKRAPVIYKGVNLNFFKTVNILHEIVSEDYRLSEFLEQMVLIKEFREFNSINLTHKKFLILLTKVAGKHLCSYKFYRLIDIFALWNPEYGKYFSNSAVNFFKRRLLQEEFDNLYYPIKNHIKLRKELNNFNNMRYIKSISLEEIISNLSYDFLNNKISEERFRSKIDLISKTFQSTAERIHCFLSLNSYLIGLLLKPHRMRENDFILIVKILLETIHSTEKKYRLLNEIIKALRTKKMIELADFLENHLLY